MKLAPLAVVPVALLVSFAASAGAATPNPISCFKHHGWQTRGSTANGDARPKGWKYKHAPVVVGQSPGQFVKGSWWAVGWYYAGRGRYGYAQGDAAYLTKANYKVIKACLR